MFPRSLVPKSNIEQFEETSYKNPKSFRMNLIDGQLDILPAVEFQTGMSLAKDSFYRIKILHFCIKIVCISSKRNKNEFSSY